MEPQIEALIGGLVLPDGVHWDEDTQNLYFVDTNDKSIYRYSPETKVYAKAALGLSNITVILPVQGHKDRFLITHRNRLSTIFWDGKSEKASDLRDVASLDGAENGVYIWCDGKADPRGKFWAGAMIVGTRGGFAEKTGTLYNLEAGGAIKRHFNSLTIPNGLTWNRVTQKFYFIDSPTRRIEQFDYDAENSTITNRTRLFTFDDHNIPGAPDGMTIDTGGNLWVTCFGGGMVIKIDPTKKETLLEQIRLPAQQVSSLTFGGRNLDELYIATARIQFGPAPAPQSPENGVLYRITGLGVVGYPGTKVTL